MSTKSTGEWLLSHNKYTTTDAAKPFPKMFQRKALTISVTSGKGGVGKTSVSVKMARELAAHKYKVLLIDCDYNLSNTAVKLGLPLTQGFVDYKNQYQAFDECLHKDGHFHLFSACNGSLELFEEAFRIDQLIVEILVQQERNYDFIILDCPAGLSKDTLALNAYSDFRFFVVTPDKSSVTDSYSLIKILNKKFGIKSNHLIVNKVSTNAQYSRIIKTLSETTENFLSTRLKVLGGLPKLDTEVDLFDRVLLKNADSKFHQSFLKILNKLTEESDGISMASQIDQMPYVRVDDHLGHDVRPNLA